jgi:hypothetical protein
MTLEEQLNLKWEWRNTSVCLKSLDLHKLNHIKSYIENKHKIHFHYGLHRFKWICALNEVIKYKKLELQADSILNLFKNSRFLRSEEEIKPVYTTHTKVEKKRYFNSDKIVEELKTGGIKHYEAKPNRELDKLISETKRMNFSLLD